MHDKIALRMMRCPKCRSKHIDEFENGCFWFLRRDCGYNSPVYRDEAKAISAFCSGEDSVVTKIKKKVAKLDVNGE